MSSMYRMPQKKRDSKIPRVFLLFFWCCWADLEIVHFVSGNLPFQSISFCQTSRFLKHWKKSILHHNLYYWALLDIKVLNPWISDTRNEWMKLYRRKLYSLFNNSVHEGEVFFCPLLHCLPWRISVSQILLHHTIIVENIKPIHSKTSKQLTPNNTETVKVKYPQTFWQNTMNAFQRKHVE